MSYKSAKRKYDSLFAALSPAEQTEQINLLSEILLRLLRGEDWRAALPPSPAPRYRRPRKRPRRQH